MKRLILLIAISVLFGVVANGQYHYAFYYDTTGGQDLEVSLLNTMPRDNGFTVTVHDAYGGELWSLGGSLAPNQAVPLRLADYLPASEFAWGVVTVDSAEQLVIGLEYFLDEKLISIDTIYREAPVLNPNEDFWLGAYYNQVGSSETALIVMNPWATTGGCSITVRTSDGTTVYQQEFVLGPHESEYIPLTDELGHGNLLWGFVDVGMSGQSVILAVEYYGRGCAGLEIDNITEYYY